LARQDDLQYVIIKSKAVSLICICSCYFLGWSGCGPIRFILYFGFGPIQAQQFSGCLYKVAGRLGFREVENYVELLVPTCVYHPSGVGVLRRRLRRSSSYPVYFA
jgi:hypothetical protein